MKLVIPESGTDPLHRSGHGTEKRTLAQNHAAAGRLFPGRRCPAGYRHRGRGPMERKEPALISLLARLFIKPDPAREEPETRRAYGVLCGIVGICLNVLLFAGKFLAGTLSGSIAITADAFNNLSDAGSSFVTLVGFQLAGQKPDSEHPFGHGRMEYVSGLAVSVLILLMGLELGKTSIGRSCIRNRWTPAR